MYVTVHFLSYGQKGFSPKMSTNIVLTSGTQRLDVTIDGEDGCETLANVLDLYRDGLNIPADANIAVDGETVDPDEFDVEDLEDGAIVSATKTSGSKG